MSKDKGGKNVKKAPQTSAEKPKSAYQNGKKSSGTNDLNPAKKK